MSSAHATRPLPRALGPVVGLALGLSGLFSGCFFTEVINEAPVPGIRVLEGGPYYVGRTYVFDATKSVDDDRQGLVATWKAASCVEGRMPNECIPVADATEDNLDTAFAVTVESHETLQVQLSVTDALGATRRAPAILTIDISNQPPVIDMQVTGYREGSSGPFVLSRVINLIPVPEVLGQGLVDRDGDVLDLEYQLLPPAGSNPALRSFTPDGAGGYVLVPDVAGEWGVILTADDGFGGVDTVRRDFSVGPDGPPCLQGMDPQPIEDSYYLVDSSDGARRFSVLSVLDALDPFPAAIDDDPVLGEARFRWLVQEPGSASFVEVPGFSASSYLVDPLVYSPGDSLVIRVEVSDRVVGPERVLPCAPDAWDCQLDTGSGCFQRQSWGVQIQ